jgi:phenylacetate-CoA ligase
MLIVRGVNVFPSQIEHAIVGIAGLAPQYQIELGTRHDRQDEICVRIEMTADAAADPGARVSLERRTRAVLHSSLALSVVVELVAPGVLPRSEGKAVRVVDRRDRGN